MTRTRSAILVGDSYGSWHEPSVVGYVVERDLQDILAEHPELVPGVGSGAVTCTELSLDTGPVDLVVVGADASVTIVECKLARNREVRRLIVGQLFDYASALRGMSVTLLDQKWFHRTGASVVGAFIGDNPDFAGALQATLDAGTFRLVIAVDAINSPLRRMVEYLNGASGVSVVAVEYVRVRVFARVAMP